MSKEKQIEGNRIEFERNEMSEIIAQSFHPCDMEYDPSDFEWSAHSLQMAGYHKKREGGKYIMLEDIQQFPIRKDHYDKGHGSEHFVFGVESVIEYAENLPTYDIEPKAEWISVDERLPEDDLPKDTDRRTIRCLVATNKGTVKACVRQRYILASNGELSPWCWSKDMFAKPTHWMPLPEPPMMKGGEE